VSALTLITAPTLKPITVQQAKDHARVEYHEDDELIDIYLDQVVALAEQRMGRAIMTQTWELTLDRFPLLGRDNECSLRAYEIRLPNPPLVSVTSIKYDDSDGVEQTLSTASYDVDSRSEPGRVSPALGYSWPSTYSKVNAVRIRYVCGWATPASVPAPIRSWLMARIATFHAFREQMAERQTIALPHDFVDGLLDPYRVYVDVP
jgi:uncharacterized phiE125 gp8 family phage protein